MELVPPPITDVRVTIMKRAALAAISLIVVIGLAAACKMNLTTDVHWSNLRGAAVGTVGLTAPGTMAFEVPGTDECDEHASKISAIMSGVVEEFYPRGCKRHGLNSFLLADTEIPILGSTRAWMHSDALFGIVAVAKDDAIEATMYMNLDKYRILTARMEDQFNRSVDLAASAITIVLNNDSREAIEFEVDGVFVDGEPVLVASSYELQRRHRAEIRFSNVATAYLARHGTLGGILLRKRPAPADAVLDAFTDDEIGRFLDRTDRQAMERTIQHTLETVPSGTTKSWRNPNSGNEGSVTPTETYQRADGTYCRKFIQTVTVAGGTRAAYGTACRQADGVWKIVVG